MRRVSAVLCRSASVIALFVAASVAPRTLPTQVSRADPEHSYEPPNGFVPDSTTATRIAEAILVPIYSEGVIAKKRPFRARLVGDVWTVECTLACGSEGECIGA